MKEKSHILIHHQPRTIMANIHNIFLVVRLPLKLSNLQLCTGNENSTGLYCKKSYQEQNIKHIFLI